MLAGMIIHSSKLNGINVSPQKQVRISQYADDTILFLDGSYESLKGAMQELDNFARISGLKVNVSKTSCLPIGTLTKDCMPEGLGINIVDELKVLGITISNKLENITIKNIKEKMTAVRKDLHQWKRRNLTPIGKICIIKTILISKLVHLFISLPNPPTNFFKEIEGLLFDFIWNGKRDKIKRTKLMQGYEQDGLKMINIRAFIDSMKLTWLKRFISSTGDWTEIARTQLPPVYQLLTYGKEKLKETKSKITNEFYSDIIDALIRFTTNYHPSSKEILTETLWFSDHSGFPKSIIKVWNMKGLRFVSDLFDQYSGKLLSREDLNQRYNININFLSYERLVHKVPENLVKDATNDLNSPVIPFKIQAVMLGKTFTKLAYKIHLKATTANHKEVNQRIKSKWENAVGQYETGTLVTVMNTTKSTYLAYFHYKIITRIYPTNKLLELMNIAEPRNVLFAKTRQKPSLIFFGFVLKLNNLLKIHFLT